MTAVVAGKLLFLFLPFLLSLFGKGGMAKMLCLVTSMLVVLRSVSDYGAVLPWVTGMLISGVSVWERIGRGVMPKTAPKADHPTPKKARQDCSCRAPTSCSLVQG